MEKLASIKIRENTKQELIRIRGELERRYGRKFSLDDTIKYLIRENRGMHSKDPQLLDRIFGILRNEDLYGELLRERRGDEERIKRKFGL
ncbi:MAG: hypothetical protein QW396_03175 [Metallosphaera sp.]|uniref:hypothetical protein n=1 Tax=Metallosphaera sp. TaxID=2020860 RepID=UPI0031697D7D